MPTDVSLAAGELRLLRGGLEVRVRLAPFTFAVRRATNAGGFASAGTGGRRVVREGGVRVWDGVVHDQFIPLTEGVVAHEEREPPEVAASAASLVSWSADSRVIRPRRITSCTLVARWPSSYCPESSISSATKITWRADSTLSWYSTIAAWK